MNVFVTGSAGYIGGAVARGLVEAGLAVRAGVRSPMVLVGCGEVVVTGDLADAVLDFAGVDCVVHAAGLGHRRGVAEAVWRRANVEAAVNVARAARAAGVARFVLVSTAHVYGRVHEGVVSDATPPNPMDDYAASKLEAEGRVAEIVGDGLTVVRPVAVIGPHCPGNLQLVMSLLARRVPLPFGAIANRRSFIAAADLARLILAVLKAQAPAPMILAAHPDAISTPAVIAALARGMGVKPILLSFPPALLGLAAQRARRGAMWHSLAGSFVADPQNAVALDWRPRETLVESLEKTGSAYTVS